MENLGRTNTATATSRSSDLFIDSLVDTFSSSSNSLIVDTPTSTVRRPSQHHTMTTPNGGCHPSRQPSITIIMTTWRDVI